MANRKFTVGFTRLDGIVRHAEVAEGTKVSALLKKFGFNDNEIPTAVRDMRINGAEVSEGADYLLKEDDTVAIVPNVKGGAR